MTILASCDKKGHNSEFWILSEIVVLRRRVKKQKIPESEINIFSQKPFGKCG